MLSEVEPEREDKQTKNRESFRTLHGCRDLLEVVADQSMAGSDVNWNQLGAAHPTTALPEYPFDMRSYWIPLKKPAIPSSPRTVAVDLDSSEWNHVKDHVINKDVIVPGATFLRIIERLHPRKTICGVDFLAPITPSSTKILFSEKESEGARTLCSDGMDAVSFSISEEKKSKPAVPPMESPQKVFKSKEIYERFSLSALMYQQRFQVIKSIGVSTGKGMAILEGADRVDVLIDGALQAVAMGYLLEQPGDHHPWLPFNIEQVRILGSPAEGQAKAFFTYFNNGAFLNGDVSVFDRHGKLLVDIKNICFRRKEIEGRAAVSVSVAKKTVPLAKTSDALRKKAKNYVLKWFDESFGWNELDEKADFFDLGLSSLQAVRLRNYLRKKYPSASTTSVFDHPTILDLSNYLGSLEGPPEQAAIIEKPTEDLLPPVPLSRLSQSPIGIRSSSCRLPGAVQDPADFWQLLLIGKNASSRTPANRIPSRNVLIKGQKYGASVEGGNFIDQDVSAFDPSFFKISKSEAEMMDPQQRLLLECVEECIENSGDMDMTEVGVFVGLMEKEYVDLMEQQQTTVLSMLGSMVAVIAGRVNYVFGSYGPSVTVDTACSSSLVAVEMAVNALLDGRCRRAIVAGVNLILSEKGQGHRSNGKMLSVHGMSLSFDARASGYGRSDGCVVLMLEKVKPTMRYLSIINGVNVNHGGRSVSLTAPNGVAHKILLNHLFKSSPGMDTAVWEAHGTGTSLGDPIEVNTLSSLLQDVVVSSTKASLGHGEASAGTCGLLKLSLTLDHDYVPALIHFHVLNKDIQMGSLRLPVVGEEQDFVVGGISSFGVSGTNAAVLAQKNPEILQPVIPLHNAYILPVSAKSINSLTAFQSTICDFVQSSQESLSDICGVLSSRIQHPKRTALLVSRGRNIAIVEKGAAKPEFYLSDEELNFDLLAIEEIGEYFEYLGRYDLDNGQRLLLALVKFLKNAIDSFKWLTWSSKSHAIFLLATGSLEVDDESVRLLDGAVPEKFRERMSFKTNDPDTSSISIGERITNLKSLLKVLGELYVNGVSIDWSLLYSPPSRFILLPTYPFNRQTVWFSEKKTVFDHYLIGTETKRTKQQLEYENQLSPMRHPAIFKHGFCIGDAVLAMLEVGRRAFSSSFQIQNFAFKPFKPGQAVWLETTSEISGETASVVGTIGSAEIFKGTLEKSTTQPSSTITSPAGEGEHIFVDRIPSTVVKVFGGMIMVDTVYDCQYMALFHILAKRGYTLDGLELASFDNLGKQFTIKEEGGKLLVGTEKGICLEIRTSGVPIHHLPAERKVVEKTVEEKRTSVELVENKESSKGGGGLLEIREKIKKALADVLPEEITDDTQGFMEMGMDSLTLVDFVNRLSEKYFPNSEVSTTDIFDHPSLDELACFMASNIGIQLQQIPEPKEDVKPVAELLLGKGKLEEIKKKICLALYDVLPEEPEDLTIGFMEMGMDSLTLVDFVNRLNEKYFPLLEISTTDVFDNPTVAELSQDILTKLTGPEEELKISVDSGIGCSGEVSPRPDSEETLDDVFFFVDTPEKRSFVDYKLVARNGKLVILNGNQELAVDEKSLAKLRQNGKLSMELEDGQIDSEDLFTGLIGFCKQLEATKISLDIAFPRLFSSSQYMARAFMKTAAAEKPGNIRYVWEEQLQRKLITKEELHGRIEGFWLITGGLSGIGLSTAKWLVTEGVEGVVLISRRIPDEKLKKELEKMRRTAKVLVISADITDQKKIMAELRSLDKLDGVIHCAGLLQDGKMERQSAASFKKVFNPKAVGYDVLDNVLRSLKLEPNSFIAMSSFTSACGNIGQLNYGVANAYLDFKMEERRQQGRAGTSIHWGNWLDTGMAANKNIYSILSEYGFLGFSNEEGLKYLKYAILRRPRRFMTAKLDWNIILEKRKDIRSDLIKEGLYQVTEREETAAEKWLERVQETEKEESEEEEDDIHKQLLDMAQTLLQGKLKTNRSFMEMGFTSHALATLLERIKEKFNVKLTVAVFYEHPTLDELAEHLDEILEPGGPEEEEMKEDGGYCDVLAVLIRYNDREEFEEEVKKAIESLSKKKMEMRAEGKYLQLVQAKTVGEINTKLKNLKYKESGAQKRGKVVMMFPGQGAQYSLMGAQLAESFPQFKRLFHDCLEKCDRHLQRKVPFLEVVNDPDRHRELLLTSYMQPIMFSFCYSLGILWSSFGIWPDFYLGHSVGELVAGTLAGMMTLDEGIELIVARAKAMEKIKGRGAMLVVDSRARDEVLAKFEVSIAAENTPKQIVVAGKKTELDRAMSHVKGKQLQAAFVNTMYPFHSSLIAEEDLIDLRQVLRKIHFRPAKTPIVSNVTGMIITNFDVDYLLKHAVSAVKFVDCVETLVKEGVQTWIEAGSSGTLCGFLKRIVDPKEHLIVQSISDKGDDCEKFVEAALELEMNGLRLEWGRIYDGKVDEDGQEPVSVSSGTAIEISEEEAFLATDHKLKGELIVPGMFQVAALFKNVNEDSAEDFFTLSGVRLPCAWKLDETRKAVITRSYENRLGLEVNGNKTCLASLRIQKAPWRVTLNEELFRGCNITMDISNWYIESGKGGLYYGPHFQVLKEVVRDEKRAVGKGVVEKDAAIWPLMDGALHLVCLVVCQRRALEYYMPVSLNEVFLAKDIQLEEGEEISFFTELIADNEKFIQFHSWLRIAGKVVFEARNVTCVIFKTDVEAKETKSDNNGDVKTALRTKTQVKGMEPKASNAVPEATKSSLQQPDQPRFLPSKKTTQEVIVVGSSSSFCFASVDLPSLWQQLQLGVCDHAYSHRYPVVNPNVSFIDQDITLWDPVFFGISPKEAQFIDPMQRLLMVAVYRTLESAGFPSLPTSTGVYVGQSGMDFIQMVYKERLQNPVGHLAAGTHASCLAGRISHWLKLEGPSMVVDTACSSSFTALCLAAEAISLGKIEMAIVGGIHLILHDSVTIVLSNGGMLSRHSKAFDASADGYRRSEGIGVILLVSKEYCSRSCLPQIAKIENWHLCHNGKSAAMQVPSGNAQEDCMRNSGGFIKEVELHATGTALGDPIECSAVLRLGPSIGSSIKSHLGHAEGASGMASLLSVLLQLQSQYRLPQMHLSVPNPKIRGISLRSVGEETDFDRIRINNFGFSGSNVSLTVEKVSNNPPEPTVRLFYVIPISAKSSESLKVMVEEIKQVLVESDLPLCSIAGCYQKKPQYKHREVVLVDYKRRIAKENQENGSVFLSSDSDLLKFLYGGGVAAASGDLLTRIRTTLDEAGVVVLPTVIISPFGFFQAIAKEFLSGTSISWNVLNAFPLEASVNLPGYHFNLRKFWCLESSGTDKKEPAGKKDIYFVKKLVEKNRAARRRREILAVSETVSTYPRITRQFGNWPRSTVLLFETVSSSYSEAVQLCKLWKELQEEQENILVVAAKDNGSSFSEWTAFLRSLAAEKSLLYSFVSYQKEEELKEELSCAEPFESVHYRGGRRFVERLQRTVPHFTREPVGHLVISGGTGGIGKEIIRFLQAEKTTVLSRSTGINLALPDQRISVLDSVDLVVHAAGVVDNALLAKQTEEKFKSVGDVKVNGFNTLSCLDPKETILISSSAAIFGSLGQGNYAFANGKMVSSAEKSGRSFRATYFGPWEDVGMLAGEELEGVRRQIKQNGWNFLEPRIAVEAVLATESIVVFDGDFEIILKKNSHLRHFLEHVAAQPNICKGSPMIIASAKTVRELIEEIAGLKNLEEVKDSPLMQLGLDSLMLEELRTGIKRELGVNISSADVYDNCTVDLLEKFVLRRKRETIPSQKLDAEKASKASSSIAIIGASASFSGSRDIEEFWDNLINGKESISRKTAIPGLISASGMVPEVDRFDHKFFKMAKEDADALDPQVRVFIQHAYNALESSGYVRERRELRVAVFAGAEPSEYAGPEEEPVGSLQRMFRSNMKDFVASMTAHALDLKGPAVGVYSACSTTLLALQQAANALRLGQADLALVGGVSLVLPGKDVYEFQDGMVLSQRGQCRPFDASADGTVRGSAAGCLVLKCAEKAAENNDKILCEIRSIGTSNDGSLKASFMAPNTKGQAECIKEALSQLNEEDRNSISYVECHGTGTPVGDEIELKALAEVYGRKMILGSVKANIGHGFAGAGLASIVKAMKVLETGQIPPQINFDKLIEADHSFEFPKEVRQLPEGALVAVSSFGIGGTNGHVVLGKANGEREENDEASSKPVVLPISAISSASLFAAKKKLKDFLSRNPQKTERVAASLQHRRETFKHRSALIVTGQPNIFEIPNHVELESLSPENVAFFFSPQGVQYPNMEKFFWKMDTAFSRKMKRLCRLASEITGVDFEEVMYPSSPQEPVLIMRPDIAQVAVFIVNMATVTQLEDWGIRSNHLLGHSVGEYAALVYGEVLSEKDAIQLLYRRGQLCYETAEAAMIAVQGAPLSQLPDGFEISAILSDGLHCVVGPPEKMVLLKEDLNKRGIQYRELRTERGFHSHMLDDVLDTFQKEAGQFVYRQPKKNIISGMDGNRLRRITPDYLRRHMRRPVNLKDSLKALLPDIKLLVEIGPAGVLQNLLREEYPHVAAVHTIPTHKKAPYRTLWSSLAELWSLGHPIDWTQIFWLKGNDPYCPGYSFEKIFCSKERFPLQQHSFYAVAWIPERVSKVDAAPCSILVVVDGERKNESIGSITPEELSQWVKTSDILVYMPQGNENSFFTAQLLLQEALRLKTQKLVVVSNGDPLDWLCLGPLRDFQLTNKDLLCQFIDNSDGMSVQEVVERVRGNKEGTLLLTRNDLFSLGYAEQDEQTPKLEGTVVIFGGFGTLGKAYISVLRGITTVENIVAVGRTEKSSKDDINYEQADITSYAEVKEVLTKILEKHGGLNVIINLAGYSTANSLRKSVEDMENGLRPKVAGTRNILRFLEETNLRLPLLILSSSLSSYVVLQGNSDYAAANCFLDGLAVKGHPRVDKIQSIQWPLWKQSRMALGTSTGMASLLQRGSISQAQGQRAIWKSLGLTGCLAFSLVHPTQLKKLVRRTQLTGRQSQAPLKVMDTMDLVRRAWKEVLSTEVNDQSNFFDLGGNSLNALRLIWFLKSANIDLSVNYVFENPILSKFYGNLPEKRQSDSKKRLNVFAPLPLSYAQENMFLLRMLEPGSHYNIVFVIEFGNEVDLERMTGAVRCLLARQLALRTRFLLEGENGSQEVLSLTECHHHLQVEQLIEQDYDVELLKEKERNFDFTTVPLRMRSLSTSSGWKLLFNQHHILTDGWSMSVLASELSQLYKEDGECLPREENVPLFAFGDRSRDFEEELQMAKKSLEGAGPTAVIKDSGRGERGFSLFDRTLPIKLVKKIKNLAKEHKTTEFLVCLTGYLLTLRRWKEEVEEDQLVVGIPVSGRDEHSQNLIGYFLNNVALTVGLKETLTLEEAIPLVEAAFSKARKSEKVPFHKLVAELGVERIKDKHPIFQMYFNYRHALEYPRVTIDGEECQVRQVSMNTLFDFSTTVDETPEGLKFTFEYNRQRYEQNTIKMFADDVFRAFSLNRKTGRLLRGEVVDVPNYYRSLSSDKPLQLSLEQQYISTFGLPLRPDTIAVLNLPANIAAQLISTVLQASMAFAPLDPSWPHERKQKTLANLHNALYVDEEFLLKIGKYGKTRRWIKYHPVDISYVIHTSGSTGTPKGVPVSHRNLNTFLIQATRQMLLNKRSRVYHSVSTAFDVSVANILGAAINSSTLVLHKDLRNQVQEAKDCSFLFLTSAVFNSLSPALIEELTHVEKLFVGGETVHDRNLLLALERGIDVTQIYGPTETAIWSLTNRCKMEREVGRAIGRPMSNETASVDGGGVRGELILAGNKVARGYLHGAAFRGSYRTKDLVLLKDGRFHFLGRSDGQVKIRGNRVELAEVERCLLETSGAQTVVVLKSQETLLAFLILSKRDPKELAAPLRKLLPAYCIPSAFLSVTKIPRNTSGKVDKERLLQEFNDQRRKVPNPRSKEYRDIVNSVEEKMLKVFSKTLNRKVARLEENFFELGGHSLLLLALQQNIKEEFGVDLPVSDLFSHPTVGDTASLVAAALKPTLGDTDISIITKLREAPNTKFNMYLVHAVGGAIFPYYAFLQIVPKDVSIYAIEFQLEYKAESLKDLAALYAKAVAAHTKNVRPFVLGHSMGGTISREMIPDLKMWGWEIPFVIMFDSWILRPDQLRVEKIKSFMESVFAPLPNAAVRVEKAVRLGTMLKAHRITKSHTKVFLFKSKELGVAAFREAVRPDLNEELSRCLVANGFERVSYKPVTTWMINGDHESCLKVENLKSRQNEFLSIFQDYL